ncbi:MAG: hypothetical protein NUV59_03695 [Patescibacteria group bacterium]|nr:hypothetical protein [Patescibacteria group bacterium]
MKRISAIALMLGLVLGIAPVASAQGLYLYGSGNSETSVGADADGIVDVNLDTSADVEAAADAQAAATGEQKTEEDAETGGDAATSASGDVQIGATIGAEVSGGTEGSSIVITRSSASADNTVAVTAPSSVSTSADLSAYASAVVETDENVDSAELSNEAVSLAYKVRAKLFGIFPVLMPATATVTASGETAIEYPWYSIFATIDSAESLEAGVIDATATTLSANASTELSASAQAQLLNQIHAAMRSNLEASLAAEASTNATAQ